ncbi:TetR/AcrR family transcriptional regulator [Nocardioides insulae]|uniref:TetR/AcrR family transcriptional regulator n=1 Tax=Nocardioides insulae TaxID=394734 RepID=UPI000415C99A|nr:TetR/AcrR family transcriptional regulator [Nocardioides insulae]
MTQSADGMKKSPVTKRGHRTRQKLVEAARVVFERDGYLDARLSDITVEAQCSTGTFYTYFTSKDEIFEAVLEAAREEMLHPGVARVGDAEDPAVIIEASNRAYLEAYRRNARLMALMEQVAHIDPRFMALRQARSAMFVERNAKSIADLQARGLADPELDPMMASRALSSMLSRLAYSAFIVGDGDLEALVHTATRIWCHGLRLAAPGD